MSVVRYWDETAEAWLEVLQGGSSSVAPDEGGGEEFPEATTFAFDMGLETEVTSEWGDINTRGTWESVDIGGERYYVETEGANTNYITWNVPGMVGDVEVVTRALYTSGTIYRGALARFSESTAFYGTNGRDNSGVGEHFLYVYTSATNVGSFPILSSGDHYFIRLRVIGSDLSVKSWKEGDEEPETWLTLSDSTFADPGLVGLYARSPATGVGTSWIGVSTDPETHGAPLPGEVTPNNADEGGGEEPASAMAYDFTLHSPGDPISAEFIVHQGNTVELADDGGTTALLMDDSNNDDALVYWDIGPSEFMEVVVLTRNNHSGEATLYSGPMARFNPVDGEYTQTVRYYSNGIRYSDTVSGANWQVTSGAFTDDVSFPAFVRLRVEGDEGLMKAWMESETEPSSWTSDPRTATLQEAFPGVLNNRTWGTNVGWVYWIGVSFDPAVPAPLPGEITPVNG